MSDITSPRLLYVKGLLFVVLAAASGALLLWTSPSLRGLALLLICVWASCRAYYFAFYVVEHYVDPGFRFAGLADFARYAWRRRMK